METFTKGKKVACPRSWDNANLLTVFSVHYATPEEIAAHGGVCRECWKQIQKRGKAILAGKVETPADLNEHQHRLDVEQDHIAIDATGELVNAEDFDFAAVDAALGLVVESATPDARQEAGEVLRQVFAWCFPRNGHTSLRTAAARLAVLVSGLRPDALDGKTLEQIATELGRTKAALSKTSGLAEKQFGVHFTRSRSLTARQHMAAAQKGHKPTYTKKRTSNHTVTNEPAEGGGTTSPTPSERIP